jgi:hypothetical protein
MGIDISSDFCYTSVNLFPLIFQEVYMLQFIFEVFAKPKILTLDDLGYETIEHDFFEDPDLILMGLVRPDYRKIGHLKSFKRNHQNQMVEYLFINREKIIQSLFVENIIVYKKAYESEKNTVFDQYNSILDLMPKFNHIVEEYKQHNQDELLKIASYLYKKMKIRGFDDKYDNSCFEIKLNPSLESVYKIVNYEGNVTLETKNLKVIGTTVYKREETYIEQLNFENTGISFLPVKSCWLTEVEHDSRQKKCILELSFNNKSFFYIKAALSMEDDEYNMVIFKNLTQADMTNISVDRLIRSGSNFQKIILMKDDKMTSDFLMYTRMKRVLQNYPEALSWYLNILCKECVSEETREEFGFKLEGDLEGNELLLIEAMVI